MNKNIISKSVLTLVLLAAGIGTSVAGSDKEKLIAQARAAAPAAIGAGARQIEVAVNGIGERAGNTAFEEVVMALKTRPDAYHGLDTSIRTKEIYPSSRLLSSITGVQVQPNKAIVGDNAFAHEAGIHQDGVLKASTTDESMTPHSIGRISNELVQGKHSGRHAFRDRRTELGFDVEGDEFDDAFKRFKTLADKKKHVFDDDIAVLVDDQLAAEGERIVFKRLRVVWGTDGPQTAEIDRTIEGEEKYAIARGNGPVDAVFNAIRQIVPHEAKLDLYQVHAVTGGTDAQATVSVRLNGEGIMATGRSSDPDTLVASAKAYLHAVNKLEARKAKRKAA